MAAGWLQYGKELERREFRIYRSFAFFIFGFPFLGSLIQGQDFFFQLCEVHVGR
jgi:hypothetical protein